MSGFKCLQMTIFAENYMTSVQRQCNIFCGYVCKIYWCLILARTTSTRHFRTGLKVVVPIIIICFFSFHQNFTLFYILDLCGTRTREEKEGIISYHNVLNINYLPLYIRQFMQGERRNPLPPKHRLLFPISSKGYFRCTIPQTGQYIHSHGGTSRSTLDGVAFMYMYIH